MVVAHINSVAGKFVPKNRRGKSSALSYRRYMNVIGLY
nr:MAG TPA: hypothetical protein [Caudoviricetes sp.]